MDMGLGRWTHVLYYSTTLLCYATLRQTIHATSRQQLQLQDPRTRESRLQVSSKAGKEETYIVGEPYHKGVKMKGE